MNSKIIFIVSVLFCMSTRINCETIDDVVADLGPKVHALQSHISLVLVHGRQQLGLTREAIRDAADQQSGILNDRFLEASKLAQQWKKEAEAAGKNVDSCIAEANKEWDALGFHPFEVCKKSTPLDLLGVKLGELGELKSVVGKTISTCQGQNTEASGLRTCIEGELAKVQEQVDAIEGDIQTTCASAKKNGLDCITEVARKSNTLLDSTLKHLKECIQNV